MSIGHPSTRPLRPIKAWANGADLRKTMCVSVPRLLLLLSALLAVVPATAGAAKRASAPATPHVVSVKPLKLRIGDRLTIGGTGFLKGKNRNTVVFKADGQRAVFVKAQTATTTRLVVKLPKKLAPFLKVTAGQPAATRFRLRVLARRLSNAYTPAKRSPSIAPEAAAAAAPAPGSATTPAAAAAPAAAVAAAAAPPDCDGDGNPDVTDPDDDNDQLLDTTEVAIGTRVCAVDSDSDGISDAFEYRSAVDLNGIGLPYPGTRPYPNPLDGRDGNTDFDQDSLTQAEEYTLWRYSGGVLPLTYSDGDQDTNRLGSRTPKGVYPELDRHQVDGYLSDDEKDADNDGLTNFEETHGQMLIGWWGSVYKDEKQFVGHAMAALLYATSFVDRDSDGDGVPDGLDDQDHDGYTNVAELSRGTSGLWVHMYNPCLPKPKRLDPTDPAEHTMCTVHPPLTDAWAPFADGGALPANDAAHYNLLTGELKYPQPA
ncbi:MAG: hypothetical protein QOC64_3748 [Solirubrobacteraceae bacterium]|nr:hypothetical protein [Solirubrobacteraceae bacterium]